VTAALNLAVLAAATMAALAVLTAALMRRARLA
jgi:hypothetical protein